MGSMIRSVVGLVAVCVVLFPALCVISLAEFGEWLTDRAERMRTWRWLQGSVDVSERIQQWTHKTNESRFDDGGVR